ncbi:MAG: hypothetical protein PF689_14370 [Deltaproteobacteria bacterium]|jgi:DNA excision repair protein ERCC-2|nr:hypothetical protein [Deltaproteobacteria bacterium]
MPEFSLGVTTLVNTVLRSGDLNGFSAFSKRGIEGIKGHQSWQNSRTESYESEVSLNFRFSEDDFSLQLQGRIDGIYNDSNSGYTLEEIKTTTLSSSRVKRDSNPSHWAQLYLYAFMYSKLNNLETIHLQLVYLHQKTGEVKIFKDQKTTTQLEEFCSQ